MNLTELAIHGFRAFPPEEERFEFDGDNAVILGDNGTGKSSILAAVEFLLCGNLSHLSGDGTNNIDVRTHAPHQHAEPEECYVEGTFVTEEGDTGTVRRAASDPTSLESISGNLDTDEIDVSQWNDDHLILTRGQLLNFIETAPSNRGDQLSKLLNLSGVRNRARGFGQIESEIEQEVSQTESTCSRLVGDIASSVDLDLEHPLEDSDKERIKDEVNSKLELLDAEEIDSLSELDSAMASIDLEVAGEVRDSFYQTSTQRRTEDIIASIEDNQEEIQENLRSLSEKIDEFEEMETRSIHELELFDAAGSLVTTETVECPLCGENHEEGYLQERIREQLDRLSDIEELRDEIDDLQEQLLGQVGEYYTTTSELVDQLREGIARGEHVEVHEEIEELDTLIAELDELAEALERSFIDRDERGMLEVRTIDLDEIEPSWLTGLSSLRSLHEYMDSLEPRDRFTEAHADLVRIQDAWNDLIESEEDLDQLRELRSEMDQVINLYSEAREETLGDLYSSIEDNFNDYYTTIHPDESKIDFDFDFDGTDSVELEANHGIERDSPLAYHSEGHIDTMGLCLFFALREELNTSGADIVLLDDIVMSIDKNHRRGVVRLLDEYFEDSTQAILATHDEVWADQLKEQALVPRNNVVNIANWDLSTGPILSWGNWDLIQQKLDDDEPHSAAAHLRRTAEKVGRIAALRLQVSLQFKDRYALADYIYAISGKISSIASSTKGYHPDGSVMWETAQEIDDTRSDLLGDFGLDELNGMVHYNRHEWGQLAAADLQDVLDHWRDINEFLTCSDCGSMLQYSEDGDWRWVHCDCRNIEIGYED